ncbi:putative D-amino acid oxidase [Xylariaceae sp. FL0662B]|nr:putative D-amino acid oxidase [Xylariaceae sp. FL0662B]
MTQEQKHIVVLGAGVVGLTTALELKQRVPSAAVVIAAKHFPGDRSIEYCSPWAGANWMTTATDNGVQEEWDAVTYRRFAALADADPGAGITRMPIRAFFDRPIEEADVLSQGTGRIWYDRLVEGGVREIPAEELPDGACFGITFETFMVNTQPYLAWLNVQCLKNDIEMRRTSFEDIRQVFRDIPADAYFNCTGLGSRHLKGVEDADLYPTRGQVILVETPKAATPMKTMYFRSPHRVDSDTTYVFPRYPTGGVILGGCRIDNDWSGEVDLEFAEDIKRRCCALAPELGRPEDLKVVYHAVGLRPSRKGGSRVEPETIDGKLVIHNYGAGGTGYQSSWGTAKYAVDHLIERTK